MDRELLIEIGVEELPASWMPDLTVQLAKRLEARLNEYRIAPGAPVQLPVELPGRRHIYNQFVIRAARRDALRDHLRANGVGCEVYYPVPFHLQPCFAYLGVPAGMLPAAERAAAETLALPIYSELDEAQQRYVVETVAAFYAQT